MIKSQYSPSIIRKRIKIVNKIQNPKKKININNLKKLNKMIYKNLVKNKYMLISNNNT